MRRLRLYVNLWLKKGDKVKLSLQQTHYLKNVMRVKLGDNILIFNGKQGEWMGRILSFGKQAIIDLHTKHRPQPEQTNTLCLAFSLLKPKPMRFLIEKATELGVDYFHPLMACHTQYKHFALEKYEMIMQEACEQSGRLNCPSIQSPQWLDDFLQSWNPNHPLLFCDERLADESFTYEDIKANKGGEKEAQERTARHLAKTNQKANQKASQQTSQRANQKANQKAHPQASQEVNQKANQKAHQKASQRANQKTNQRANQKASQKKNQKTNQRINQKANQKINQAAFSNLTSYDTVGILVGPEGGFSKAEQTHLLRHSFVRQLYLGETILRAETACLMAISLYKNCFI